jgi:hypothetical protein
MLGLFFLFLGVVAAKVTIWQSGLLSVFWETTQPPDHPIAALSLTAAIIFFGLWRASRTNPEKLKSRSLFD